MPLVPANQPQLIRSSQKDEYYQTSLRNNANEAFQTLAGSRRWLQWRKEVELLSDLAYYALTTLSGYQTLGEEYVSVIQVDPTRRRIPSRTRRLALVLFHAFVPYVLDKLLVCIEHELEVEEWDSQNAQRDTALSWSPMSYIKAWIQSAVRMLNSQQRKSLKPVVYAAQQGITILHRVHVALFYISGAFYHLAKRTSGISYLRVQGMVVDDPGIRTSYRLLGCVSLLQLAITLALQFNNLRQWHRARHEWTQHRNLPSSPQETSSSRSSRCILCLEERRHSTTTPCGHLFCWECITEWCNTKTECPLCREKFQPHRLVYLRSYR
ncbi:peroxisome biogenesis factor 10 [Ictalurus furcatus]|uniref:peroxisome biogenesis factor 10 n=1 Tax=Ictalurus furcatus TaxID=66913 RepID=UPI00235000BB|nr:peroxisome biogenesis factor 10 [Ictalurus furcatus]